jgi:hypothetical protein
MRRPRKRSAKRRRRRITRKGAAQEAIEKTGNWQKILRERIEGLSWGCIADKTKRGLRPQLALSGGWGRSGGTDE